MVNMKHWVCQGWNLHIATMLWMLRPALLAKESCMPT